MKEIQPSNNLERQIGFQFVKATIEGFCNSEASKEIVKQREPFANQKDAELSLRMIAEYQHFVSGFGKPFKYGQIQNLEEVLGSATKVGYRLELDQVVQIFDFLVAAGPIFKRLNNYDKLNHLSVYIHPSHILETIEKEIAKVLSSSGKIKPNATPALQKLIIQESEYKDKAWRVLTGIFKNLRKKDLVSEEEPRIINGRYVVPIKSSEVGSIKGVAQGRSDSLRTSYIEPLEVIEANNEMSRLSLLIQEEINQIILRLSTKIGEVASSLLHAQRKFFQLESLNAIHLYASKFNAVVTEFNDSNLEIEGLIHPELKTHLDGINKEIQPLSFKYDSGNKLMIISGPNAGGKSVALKTICLAIYSAHCGLPICSSTDAKMPFFDGLLVDIGDNQSINDDLSTYSAHLHAMSAIMKTKCKKPFIAIDEIGAGTDPLLGGPMAEAMIEVFDQRDFYGIITTHFSNLKSLDLPNVFNASMLYDSVDLKPLFQLSIGNPGSSFVFELAKRMKIHSSIIQRAKQLSRTEESNLEELLSELDKEKAKWAVKNKELKNKSQSLEKLIADYDELKNNLLKEKKKIINQAKKEAQFILKDANKAIENTVREIKEKKASKPIVKKKRKEISQKKDQLEEIKEVSALQIQPKPVKPLSFKVGDWVSIDNETKPVEILKLKNNKAEVFFQNIRTSVNINRLHPASKVQHSAKNSNIQEGLMNKLSKFNTKLDIRGLRLEQGSKRLEEHLDEAYSLGLKEVTIVHGKGEGALRKATRELLKKTPFIQDWKYEHADRGGEGVTHITLR